MAYIPATHFIIADAKRGDIGNTSDMYARAFFEAFKADAVTVAPYMGHDSVSPFLQYPGKWAIVLGLTSNAGSADFQSLQTTNGQALYQQVIAKAATWGTPDNMMFVVGATHPDMFSKIREIVPHHFLLVPGVGAQGGDLKAVCQAGLNDTCGLLINNSRQVIYAGQGIDFANHAAMEAEKLQTEMEQILQQAGLL
jgi:orotidine-5'-phosphate decarboxylase